MTELLYQQDSYLQSCDARVTELGDSAVCLDRTVCYPMGGGQPGDSGKLITADGRELLITDTRKDRDTGKVWHLLNDIEGLNAGEQVHVAIDWSLRHRRMRMHTCLHLLCALVKGGVTGGSVSDVKGRLDFDLPEQTLDKAELTEQLNRLIQEDHAVTADWISEETLNENPGLVRTMSVKPPVGQGRVRVINIEGVDLQPCGGTHVSSTAEIGAVQVAKIEKKGRANRRVNLVFNED